MRPIAPLMLFFGLSCGGEIGVKAPGFAICDGQLNEEEEIVDGPFDQDGDGFYDASNSDCQEAWDAADLDCDDADPDVGGPETWYRDADGDIYGVEDEVLIACEAEAGYVAVSGDCDDTTAARNPGEDEICDGIDNNCNDIVDDDLVEWVYTDADGDGYGDPDTAEESCDPRADQVTNADDCDDDAANAHPDADEICDGLDNDCDDIVDNDLIEWFYEDADGDGWGATESAVAGCEPDPGYVSIDGDCDDSTAARAPDLDEICDGLDNDCDDFIDEDLSSFLYLDADGDGHGDRDSPLEGCEEEPGYVESDDDCDDTEPAAFPGGEEICDEIDNDCDGSIDELASDVVDWYPDMDGDGWGDDAGRVSACFDPGGHIARGGDCDDLDPGASPGLAEVCDDEVDNNCDGTVDEGCGLDRSGIYDLDSRPYYSCAWGSVSINFDQIQVIDTTPTISFTSIGSAAPGTLTGTIAGDDSFTAYRTFTGSCTETYSITGEFTSADTFDAVVATSFTGGVFCFDCTGRTWGVTGTR